MTFPIELQRARTARGLSQAELARRAHVDMSTISRLQSGVRQPTREMVMFLAEGLGATACERDTLLAAAGLMPVDTTAFLAGEHEIGAALEFAHAYPTAEATALLREQVALAVRVARMAVEGRAA